MVFAFAGDSTMTRFFAIFLLFLVLSALYFVGCMYLTKYQVQSTKTYNRLTKHLPGSALTSSRISKESSTAVSSEIGSSLLSNNQSTCAGVSGVNNLNTLVSDAESPSGTSESRSDIDVSFFRSPIEGGKSVAATCCGNSAAMSCHCCTSFAPAPLIK